MNIVTEAIAKLWADKRNYSMELLRIAETSNDMETARAARSLSDDLWQQCNGIQAALAVIEPEFDIFDYYLDNDLDDTDE